MARTDATLKKLVDATGGGLESGALAAASGEIARKDAALEKLDDATSEGCECGEVTGEAGGEVQGRWRSRLRAVRAVEARRHLGMERGKVLVMGRPAPGCRGHRRLGRCASGSCA